MKYQRWLQLAEVPGRIMTQFAAIWFLVLGLTAPARAQTIGNDGFISVTNGCFVLRCPTDRTVFTCGDAAAVRTYNATAFNICTGGALNVVCDPPLPASLPIGTHTIKCVALAGNAKVVSCAFNITVAVDTKPPVIECPKDITVGTCNRECVMVKFPSIVASDTSGEVVIICDPPSGSCFPLGITEVKCVAINRCQQTAVCSFKVVVQPRIGDPKIECPAPVQVTVPCGKDCATVNYPLPKVVNGVLVGCKPAPGSCFPIGVSTVLCVATNECGGVTRCEFLVRVIEAPIDPPVIACPDDIAVFTCGDCERIVYPTPVVVNGKLAGCSLPSGTCFPLGVTPVICVATNDCGPGWNASSP